MRGSDTIEHVHARRVWDSRGRPTVEAEVRLADGSRGRGIAPSGASTGRFEALERRDGGPRLGGRDVAGALEAVTSTIGPALRGRPAGDQAAIDAAIAALDPSAGFATLGGNAAIAVSLAVLRAAACRAGVPLWRHVGGAMPLATLPRPEIQVIGGGAHAGRCLDLQDLMVVARRAERWSEALEVTAEVTLATGRALEEAGRFQGYADEGGYWPAFERNEQALETLTLGIERAGFRPGEDVVISVDVAAGQLAAADGRVRLALDGETLEPDAFAERFVLWCGRFPLALIEDPVADDDLAGAAGLRARLPAGARVVGDDLVATRAERIEALAAAGAGDAVLVKPNQAGTVTGALEAAERARALGLDAIVSARSGDTEDTSIVDLAVGWQAPGIKVGALARGERTAKWNRGLRIAEALDEPPLAALDARP